MPPFLTALAPEARVKGSRDPLGLLPLWARIGRRGIGNVTTVSGDLRGWTQLLVAVGMARTWGTGSDREALSEAVLQAEQLIAHSRVWHAEFREAPPAPADDVDATPAPTPASAGGVRGVSRCRVLLREADRGRSPIPLGATGAGSILGNQRSAGVWGQIAASAHASQLLDRDRVCLRGAGQQLWDEVFQPALAHHARSIRSHLRPGADFAPGKRDQPLAEALASLHRTELHDLERSVYRSHILDGAQVPDGPEIQASLIAAWLTRDDLQQEPSRPRLDDFAKSAREASNDLLADWLTEVRRVEDLLGPVERLFSRVLLHDLQDEADFIDDVNGAWAPRVAVASKSPRDTLEAVGRDAYGTSEHHDLLMGVARALGDGDWVPALSGVVELNAWVMKRRKGAPWVERLTDGRLKRWLGEGRELPQPLARDTEVLHSYYLDPLRRLALAWKEGAHAEA